MRLVPILLTGVLLSACGGGGNTTALPHAVAPSNGAPQSAARSTVTFTIAPATIAPSATKRRAQYISPSMQSLVVTLTVQGGAAVASPQPYAVNTASCPMVSGTPTCSVSLPADVGTDSFTVATYDAAQSSSTPANLTGNVLSVASTSVAVPAGANTIVPLTLDGVVHSVAVALANANPPTRTAATIPLIVTAKDADGNVIVGPGAYSVPITLSDSDTSGATALSTTSVTSPSTVVNVTYTGARVTASFSASAPGVASATTMLVASASTLLVSYQNVVTAFQTTPPYNQIMTIATGLNNPFGIAVDASGNIYVVNGGNDSVTEYTSSGAGPTRTFSYSGFHYPSGIAVDASGNVYVTDQDANPSAVDVFAANATGAVTPIATLDLPSGDYACADAFDANGNLYVATYASTINVFAPNGTALPTLTTGPYGTTGVAVDATGKIYVSYWNGNGGLGSIAAFDSTYAPSTPAILSGIDYPENIAVDTVGNIYSANNSGNNVTIYSPVGTLLGTIPNLTGAAAVAVF